MKRLKASIFERSKAKYQRKLKKAIRSLTSVGKMEVAQAAQLVLKFAHLQLKIRPRIRLVARALPLLVILYLASSTAIAYLKPMKAEIKINGQAILVAEENPVQREGNPEISQDIRALRSPFLYEKPIDGPISQGFRSYHRALDITSPVGTEVRPIGPGIVAFAGFIADGKGNVVIVDHGDDIKTLYAHMGKIYVGTGNVINTNDSLGTVGLTGRTTGPHVHFEVHDKGVQVNPGNLLP